MSQVVTVKHCRVTRSLAWSMAVLRCNHNVI